MIKRNLTMSNALIEMVQQQKNGQPVGIYSACSANDWILQAVLQRAKANGQPALIEATANQVNQYGGYTGQKPRDFFESVQALAIRLDFPLDQLILGGDHLGPLTWAHLPEDQAMAEAEVLVRDYVLAGFTKIHLDTSMRLGDDDPAQPLSDTIIAQRGARLCSIAEAALAERRLNDPEAPAPVYIIGSEVPIPGGAQEAESGVHVTRPEDCRRTIAAFEQAFADLELDDAWSRVIGLVVQPGVEFSDSDVFAYERKKASDLARVLNDWPQGVFEGHSTDYQTRQALRDMVEDGIAILKVGPALTFALREVLFAMEEMEVEIYSGRSWPCSNFRAVLEQCMLENPQNWQKHYHGSAWQQRYARKYSYSDRARYYLPDHTVDQSIRILIDNLNRQPIPLTLLHQYLPLQYDAVRSGKMALNAESLILDHIGNTIDDYLYAVMPD
jgi:D-tagatose-1,6-bisphosphate aldolase subunit GatZ/KbaZ